MLDSSCEKLGEQKHYGTTTPSQVVTKEVCSTYTRGVAYKPHCSIIMTKGVLKSTIVDTIGLHSCYVNRNVLWYKNDTEAAQNDKFLLWERPISDFHQSTLENFNILALQAKHALYLTSDVNCIQEVYWTRGANPLKRRISMFEGEGYQ